MTHESLSTESADRAEVVDERHYALTLMMDAFAEASLDGLPEDCMTQAALFVAFQKLVSCYGEEAVAVFAERLPQRIRHGEFSVTSRQ